MILCADDFGISPAVDDGILELIEMNRLSATSCMMASLNSPTKFDQLKKFIDKIEIGLHLVLTDTKPISGSKETYSLINNQGHFFKLKTLIKKSYLGHIQPQQVGIEIRAQIEAFIQTFGRSPDYIDGHQHVQTLPIIREQIVAAMKSYPSIRYVRVADISSHWLQESFFRGLIMPAAGNLALGLSGQKASRIFSKNGISHNRFLLGYWPLSSKTLFREIFQEYLRLNPTANDIFFCHPGYTDKQLRQVDALTDARVGCLEFLRSAEFSDICGSQNLFLNRFEKSS